MSAVTALAYTLAMYKQYVRTVCAPMCYLADANHKKAQIKKMFEIKTMCKIKLLLHSYDCFIQLRRQCRQYLSSQYILVQIFFSFKTSYICNSTDVLLRSIATSKR